MSFSKDLERITAQYRRRLNFVARDATLRTYNAAQQAVAKGGRMRIDTGFLRASAAAKLGSMPAGPSTNPTGRNYPEGSSAGQAVEPMLIRWVPADESFYIGWTANYARWRNYRDNFVGGATERWQEFVRRSVNEAMRKNL